MPTAAPERPRGTLLAVGGAEDKLHRRAVLRRFVAAAGGEGARVVVVPTASSLGPEIGQLYDAVLRRVGAGEVTVVRPMTRDEAHDPAAVSAVRGAGGVFMTGGNQLKLGAVVVGTPFGAAIREVFEAGGAVGGTSAGASVLTTHMVAFGPGGATPRQRMTMLAAGLGLLSGAVVDQHFEQRNRYGRLMSLVAASPSLLGIGVDEDTAAVVTDGTRLEVVGRGAVTVVDGQRAQTNAHEGRQARPLLVSGAVVHVLPAGAVFDLESRSLLGMPQEDGYEESLAGLRRAEADLRRIARRVAAEGADHSSPMRQRRARAGRAADAVAEPAPPPAPAEPAVRPARTDRPARATGGPR